MVASVLLRVKSNRFDDIARFLPKEAQAVLTETADRYVDEAKRRVPVDTGNLKRSIRIYERGASDVIVRAMGGAGGRTYAAYVEYGTIYMPAQPFMTPARDKANRYMDRELTKLARKLEAA